MLDDPLDQNVDEDDFVALREFFRQSIASRPVIPPRERFEVTTDVQMFDTKGPKPFDEPKAAPSVQQQALKAGFPSSFDIIPSASGQTPTTITIHIGVQAFFTVQANAGDDTTPYAFNGTIWIPVDTSVYNSASFSGSLAGHIFFNAGTFNMVSGVASFNLVIQDPSPSDPTGSGSLTFGVGQLPLGSSFRAPDINVQFGNLPKGLASQTVTVVKP